MATSSFHRTIILNDPDSANIIIDALLSDKRQPVNIELASDANFAKAKQALQKYFKRKSLKGDYTAEKSNRPEFTEEEARKLLE